MSAHLILGLLAMLVSPAFASAAEPVGEVSSVSGPEGAVLVVRGASTYYLSTGDALFAGDKIFTRDQGHVAMIANGCALELAPISAVVVNASLCDVQPKNLIGEREIGGVSLASPATTEGGVGTFGFSPAAPGALFGIGSRFGGGGGTGGGVSQSVFLPSATPVSP